MKQALRLVAGHFLSKVLKSGRYGSIHRKTLTGLGIALAFGDQYENR
jgi:hypothetical protein